MQCAEREAASRQATIDISDAERKVRATARGAAFEALNALSQLLDDRGAWRIHPDVL